MYPAPYESYQALPGTEFGVYARIVNLSNVMDPQKGVISHIRSVEGTIHPDHFYHVIFALGDLSDVITNYCDILHISRNFHWLIADHVERSLQLYH